AAPAPHRLGPGRVGRVGAEAARANLPHHAGRPEAPRPGGRGLRSHHGRDRRDPGGDLTMWARLRNKLLFLFRRERFDRELSEEMDFHREMLELEKTISSLSSRSKRSRRKRKS